VTRSATPPSLRPHAAARGLHHARPLRATLFPREKQARHHVRLCSAGSGLTPRFSGEPLGQLSHEDNAVRRVRCNRLLDSGASLVRLPHHILPLMTGACAAPDGELPVITDKKRRGQRSKTARAATSELTSGLSESGVSTARQESNAADNRRAGAIADKSHAFCESGSSAC
jgi:hypothetical protein